MDNIFAEHNAQMLEGIPYSVFGILTSIVSVFLQAIGSKKCMIIASPLLVLENLLSRFDALGLSL
jgi:hypothetical protein